jgi:hypothetical protein
LNKGKEEERTMLKKFLIAALVLSVAASFSGCKKKEQKPQLPPGHPPMEGGLPPTGMGMPAGPKVERTVVVSKETAAKWKGARLQIENKAAKTQPREYTVNIGSELAIPDSNLSVKVIAFLPDFRMSDKEFYTSSDKPNQPAAQIVVKENGKEIWSNWLFALQPTIHPFRHEKVGIILLGGVPK